MKTIGFHLYFLINLFLIFDCFLFAQENTDETFELRAINIIYENFKTVDRAFVLSHIGLSEGGLYNRTLSDQSLRSLYDTNFFEFVDFRISELNGAFDLTIYLTAKYQLKQIEFRGNKNFSAERLLEEGELRGVNFLDEFKVDAASKKMSNLYAENGFNGTTVTYEINREYSEGEAVVYFDVKESEKLSVKAINFDGINAFKPKSLERVMQTKKKDFFSWLSGTGKFNQLTFDSDLEKLRMFYQNAGFLDVNIDPDLIIYDFSNPGESEISITINEGEQYFLGDVKIEGASIFTEKELFDFINFKDEEDTIFSTQILGDYVSGIEDFYAKHGYIETRVFAEKKANLENRLIDVFFNVKESSKYYLESISIEGNTKTQQKVIIRELALRPGEVFDYKRMKSSEKRLKNTGFFNEVRLTPESSNIPSRKNLNILVSESTTGSLSFGAGFGSVRSTQLFFELKQANFDLNDWESGFQGAGQKFRARLSLGEKSSQALIGFEEPWLFEQRIALGTNLYKTESEYNSVFYDEERSGFEIYIRRVLFELLEAKLSYQHELVDIYNVDDFNGSTNLSVPDQIPDVFQKVVGEQEVSKITLSFLRDNRDSLLFARTGNRTSLDATFAGFGGDVDYFKFDARTAQFIPTYDLWNQNLSIIGRLGMIIPLEDDKEAPFYDRFYLGGPESLRGYDYRDIGPRATDGINTNSEINYVDETSGGHTYGLISAEYLFQVSEGLGLVVFYDGGFVNEKEEDFNLDDYADNAGIGARFMMMGSPLKLDYAYPLKKPDHITNSPQFHFSFGTRY